MKLRLTELKALVPRICATFADAGLLTRNRFRLLALTACLALFSSSAYAQGCAMCYSTAAATTKDGQRAISKAVAILLIPPVGFMTLGMGLAVRYSRKRDRAVEGEPQTSGEEV